MVLEPAHQGAGGPRRPAPGAGPGLHHHDDAQAATAAFHTDLAGRWADQVADLLIRPDASRLSFDEATRILAAAFTLTSPRALALLGPLTLTYAVRDDGPAGSRLVVKLSVGERGDGPLHRARRRALAWGDLLLMHRQLTTLRRLAAAD